MRPAIIDGSLGGLAAALLLWFDCVPAGTRAALDELIFGLLAPSA